jgi:hypothetical protein
MKKLLTLALVLSSATAFATRSRVTALGNAAHLTDVSGMYTKPAQMMMLADSVTIESGSTNVLPTTATTNSGNQGAEGLMIRSMDDAKFALSLGHDDETVFGLRKAANSATVVTIAQQNPIELSYGMKAGDISFAGTLMYSNFENKTAASEQKENSMGLKFGAAAAAWDASATLILADKWEAGTGAALDDYKGTGFDINAGYFVMSDLYVYGGVKSTGFKTTNATVAEKDVENMNIHVGVLSTIKKEGTEFFYGARLNNTTSKDKVTTTDSKSTEMNMPLIIGLEADANSWLTLRGSVTQTLLLVDTKKVETGTTTTTDTNPGANTTTLSAGAGLKFNKIVLDGSILASGSQVINSANLLGQVGMTYSF